jgi:U3 small nucleolar RNA-associated protein 3
MIQTASTLNLAMYMLLKAELGPKSDPALIQCHPVMLHLQKLNTLSQKLEDDVERKVPGLTEQLENVVKAASLMQSSGDILSEDDSDEEQSDDGEEEELDTVEEEVAVPDANDSQKKRNVVISTDLESSDDESSSEKEEEKEKARAHKVLTEARFGLRPNEISSEAKNSPRKRRRAVFSEAGDDDMEETQQKAISQSLASTLNSIEQRTLSKKNKKSDVLAEKLDDAAEDDGELRRGLEMMEAELGKFSDEDVADGGDDSVRDPELDSDGDGGGDDFYAKVSNRSKSRKDSKKKLYAVAPKFPRVDGEIDGERAISKQIFKNRGLVAHKSKLNRNPRVKKREQYRKALIRRKGAVREVRTDEGHKYGGEETGIKTGLSRSRKLAR